MKLAGVVILFNPDSSVIVNINSYISEIELLIVIDNSKNENNFVKKFLTSKQANYKYIKNSLNIGVAKALNQAVNIAMLNGFDWLLTMDQDSSFIDNTFFLNVNKFQLNDRIAIFSPKHIPYYKNILQSDQYIETNFAITSGNIIKLETCIMLNGFDNDLFIDEIDVDYCLKIVKGGYKIINFPNIYLIHQVGMTFITRSLILRKEIIRYDHPPFRYYYIARNRLIICSRYFFTFPGISFKKLMHFSRFLYGILIYETKRWGKIYFVFLGILHFMLGIRGKLKNH